jgi:hypothetical protein
VVLFAAAALAQGTGPFNGPSTDVLASGISENGGGAFNFPTGDNVNLDTVKIWNDQALAIGSPWKSGHNIPNAQNNLEIKKNQQNDDAITLINAEYIELGNRQALAIGLCQCEQQYQDSHQSDGFTMLWTRKREPRFVTVL